MKRIIRLTESDLARIVRRVINEQKYNDSYTGALRQLVENVNSMLPKGGYKLAFGGPNERAINNCPMGKQYTSYINVVNSAGQPLGKSSVTLAMFTVTTNCKVEGQVGSSSVTILGLGDTQLGNFSKNSQQKGGVAIPGGTLFQAATSYIKSGDKGLQNLGYALRGTVSTNAQGVKTDYSKIPVTLVAGLNDAKKSIETLVKTV
jgi:hypothetical protein